MRPEVKRWFKIVFCTLMVVFSVSIGFSDWVYPDNSGDKTRETKTPEIVAEPCCFIDDNPSKKYVKIEDALKIAKKSARNDIVYVLPGSNPIIESNCKVEKGDTLCLPYSITKDDKGNTLYNWKKIDNRVAGFADENKTKVDENRKNIVTIKSGITLTVEGTLQIGGEMGSYSAGVAGQTNGNYCEIQMEPKSKISSTGELYCFGYIKETRYIDVETEYSQEAIVDVSGGTVHIPLVIHDFKGGAITISRFKGAKQSPFEVIDILNIQSLLRFHNPAIMKAYADLYAGDKHNTTNFDIFSASNSLLNFSAGAYMESKYINKDYWVTESNGKMYSYTTSYNSGATDNGTDAVAKQFRVHNKISLYGSVSFGTMSMSINPLGVGSVNISTADVYFPVSFRQQIHIYGNLTSNYQIQIMGGCNVYVEEGATFTNSANFLGYGDDVQYIASVKVNNEDHFIANHYPKYFAGKGAKLFLKGKYTQSANGFACETVPLSGNACLDILNASALKIITTENGYKNLGGAIDKLDFLAKSPTTIIERVASGAKGGLSSIKQEGNLGKYQYFSVAIDGEYYWSTSSIIKMNDILIKTSGIYTEPGKAHDFDLTVEIYPSDAKFKSVSWMVKTQKEYDKCMMSDASFKNGINNQEQVVVSVPANNEKEHKRGSGIEFWKKERHSCNYLVTVTVIDIDNNRKTANLTLTALVG